MRRWRLGVRRFCPQKPKFSSIWVEKRLRNGSETARETAEFRPRSRPARLLEVINDRGESHCHRTRHRGGRALPVPGCPQGRFPRRSTLKRDTSTTYGWKIIYIVGGLVDFLARARRAHALAARARMFVTSRVPFFPNQQYEI